MIFTPDHGGTEWLLLTAAVAALAAAAAVALVLRRSRLDSGLLVSLPAWRGCPPRLSALVGALAALPLTAAARRRSLARADEAAGSLLEPPEPELADVGAAPAKVVARAPAPTAAEPPAGESGHPDAAFYFGGMLAERGDFDGAQALYGWADELGHAAGAFNLGVLLEHQNDWAGAEAAYRRAHERGRGEVADMAWAALVELRGGR